MPTKPTTIDEYLAGVRPEQRAALEKLRRTIQAAALAAEECINYGVPAFRIGDQSIAGFGASAKHCTYFPMSGSIVAVLEKDLTKYETSKGAIRFTTEKPLPAALVRKLVKARIAEIAAKKPKSKAARLPFDPAVTAFLKDLDHPLMKEIEAVRRIVLGADSSIREGIKWNSVSFRTADYFATVHLRTRDRVQLVFHKGAKVKDNSTKRPTIPDPLGLIEWLATDRGLVTLGSGKEIAAHKKAFTAIVKAWVAALPKRR